MKKSVKSFRTGDCFQKREGYLIRYCHPALRSCKLVFREYSYIIERLHVLRPETIDNSVAATLNSDSDTDEEKCTGESSCQTFQENQAHPLKVRYRNDLREQYNVCSEKFNPDSAQLLGDYSRINKSKHDLVSALRWLLLNPGGILDAASFVAKGPVVGPRICVCHTCWDALRKNKLPKLATANGFVIGDLPRHLQKLKPTVVE